MRRGGRTVHGDGIARGDGRAGARLDDLHGGGDTGDGLHVRKDGGYDEKEERGERPAHPSVMHRAPRARFLCGGIYNHRRCEAHAYTIFAATGSLSSPAGVHALASRRRSDHVSAPDARVDPRISTTFRLFAPAPRRGSSALLFLHCPCCPPKNPSAHRTSCMSASSPSHVFLAASLTRSARIRRLSLD